MSINREHGSGRLSLMVVMAAAMVTLGGIHGANAAVGTSVDYGWRLPDVTWSSVGSGSEMSTATSATAACGESLIARKGRKGGVKFEHGRPGHTSAPNNGTLLARKGGKGGVKSEHGRPGHT